jgi:hypothetical protein
MNENKNNIEDAEILWDKCFKLWENGKTCKNEIDNYKEYWDGKVKKPVNMSENFFKNASLTPHNICQRIVETLLSHLLDAKFSITALPKENSYANIETLESQQNVADIYTECIENVLKNNNLDLLKEEVVRWGLIGGIGSSQITWEDFDDPKGYIAIQPIDPRCMRWQINAKTIKDTSFIAYDIELNLSQAKERYGKNFDGTYNEEMCKKIDELSNNITSNEDDKKSTNYVAYKTEETSGLAYVGRSTGQNILANKVIKVVVMFLLDDTLFLEQTDNESEDETLENANYYKKMYPNGRMIVFSPNKKSKIILYDKPAPKSFKNLGNIDVFNPIKFGGFEGVSRLQPIAPIQDRINGLAAKSMWLTQNHVSGLWVDNTGQEIEDSSWVWQSVQLSNGAKNAPVAYGNDCLTYNQQIIDYIKLLEQEAFEMAGLNETMVSGVRQAGTNSADQVEALQESPMANIRLMQRNFKQYMISMGEKIIAMIKEYYNTQRLIKLSTGITDFAFARFKNENNTQMIELLDESLKSIEIIQVDPEWEFSVDVISGTEIPRSQKENALVIERMYAQGVLGDIQDPRIKEQYMRALDIPNYRAYIKLQERIMKEQAAMPPVQVNISDILKSPELSKSFNDILKALEYNSKAKAQVLQLVGLEGSIDTLEDAPIQAISSKAEITDVVAIAPDKISSNPTNDIQGRAIAGAIIDNKQGV